MARSKTAEITSEWSRSAVVTLYQDVDVDTGDELYERADMMQLLDYVRAKKLDLIVAHALGRLAGH